MKAFALKLAYDGTLLYGWQKTKEGPSVEQALEKVLYELTGCLIPLQAASRTDRGVHASGQVVQFQFPRPLSSSRLQLALNALLPRSIRVRGVVPCSPSFHPTLDVLGKEYRYFIRLGEVEDPLFSHMSWHLPKLRHFEEIEKAIPLLTGTKDFGAFCNTRKGLHYPTTIRTLKSIEIKIEDSFLKISLVADHFLYKMARNLVGLLAEIGQDKFLLEKIAPLFEEKDRKQGAMTAPAHGLFLERVIYPIEVDPFRLASLSDSNPV